MLYVIITVLFVLLVTVAVKWANAARELRRIKATTVSIDAAIAAADRRYASGIMEGERRALKAAEDAVAARAAAAARAQFRNATK